MSTKRKTISESPVRSASAKKAKRTPSKTRGAPSSSKKTPSKRKASSTRARSASATRSTKKSKKDADADTDMASSLTSSAESALSGLSSRVSGAANAVRTEYSHFVPSVVAGAKKSLDSVKDTALHMYSGLKDSVVKKAGRKPGKKAQEEDGESDDDEEDEKASTRTSRRRGTPAATRHSGRASTKQSTAATEGLTRARKSDGGDVVHRSGVELRTHKADVSHLTQHHPEGTVIQSWRDVAQVAPHLLLHIGLLVFLHWFLASVHQEDFQFKAYEWIRPRRLRNLLVPHYLYHFAIRTLKAYSLHFPVVVGLFFSTLYFFRASVRSVLLRHAETSIHDCDYHSGAFTAYFSRMMYGVVHLGFVWCYWTFYSHTHNVRDLDVLFIINAAYWASDSLANAVYRPQSQSNLQAATSFLLLSVSLLFALVDSPLPSSLGAWTAVVKPTVIFAILVVVFVQSLISASQFIHAHADFSRALKLASWGFVFALYVPLAFAGVLVPALASVCDVWYHTVLPLSTSWLGHFLYTSAPHRLGDPVRGK